MHCVRQLIIHFLYIDDLFDVNVYSVPIKIVIHVVKHAVHSLYCSIQLCSRVLLVLSIVTKLN